MRISRPCYDKPHRCPAVYGGGWKYAKNTRHAAHPEGVRNIYTDRKRRWIKWLPGYASCCKIIILPYNIRWFDVPAWPTTIAVWWMWKKINRNNRRIRRENRYWKKHPQEEES